MKFQLSDNRSEIFLQAENPNDLDFLHQMKGIHSHGPWVDAQYKHVNYADLGFAHEDAGVHYLFPGELPNVLAGVTLKLDWLTYAAPMPIKDKLRAEAASRLGYSILNAMQLVAGQTNVSGDTACVG